MASSSGERTSGKMSSIEEEMSRFEEEILSLSKPDPPPPGSDGGGAAPQDTHQSTTATRPGFQPRQTQLGKQNQGQGMPRPPGFQPRQMNRPGPGGPMSNRPNRPPGPGGFIPHQLRGNQRPPGPPRFPHLPPPPPPPHMGGPMGHGGPPMMGNPGPLPPPPLPPFAMMPPGPPPMNGPPHNKPVTVSAKPTTYASKPVLNKKKKKLKKEKEADTQPDAEDADAVKKPRLEAPSSSSSTVTAPNPQAPAPNPMGHKPQGELLPLPPPPPFPNAFMPAPSHPQHHHQQHHQHHHQHQAPADPPHLLPPQGSGYEMGAAGGEQPPAKKKDKKKKFVRVAAGTTWEDDSLSEWDPNDFRLFAGDLGNEVTEDTLTKVFGTYPSYIKCKIIRDKRTNKTKGYGFISFKDPRDFVQAMKDWNGKYVGNRPIKLLKSTWKDRDISHVRKKQKEKDRLGLR